LARILPELTGRTRSSTSSPAPGLPWKTTFETAPRSVPRIAIVLPARGRRREPQRRTQVTFAISGVAT
jgi:hypothetical protein